DFNFLTKMCLTRMREVAFEMAAQASAAGALAVVHGSDATDHTEEFLQAGFDFVLLGEAESTLAELCDRALAGKEVHSLPGTATMDPVSERVVRSPRKQSAPTIAMPWPARDQIDMARYRNHW